MNDATTNGILGFLRQNVNEHAEKKGRFTYLSWAWAWSYTLEQDPTATFEVQFFGDQPYLQTFNGYMVFVSTTVFGKRMTCHLPVLDERNRVITSPTAFDLNTAIMRCLAKSIALHGLGLYIYAGEDLPAGDAVAEQAETSPVPHPVKPVQPQARPDSTDVVDHEVHEQVLNYLKKQYNVYLEQQLPKETFSRIFKRELKSLPEEVMARFVEFAKANPLPSPTRKTDVNRIEDKPM